MSVNPALALRCCGSMLALRGPSWIKASGGFGRLHSGSCCLPYTPLLGASTQSRAEQTQATETEAINLALVQCLIKTSKGKGNMSDGDTLDFPTYRKLYRHYYCYLSYQCCCAGDKHRRYNHLRHTHTAEIQLIDISQQPLYLIACLALLLFHSLSHKHNQDTMTRTERRETLPLRHEEKTG